VLEFVQLLHEAFRTESKWLFVLYVGLGSALVFGILAASLAFLVDTGYQRSLQDHQKATISHPAPPPPTIIRDTAEENRLRGEVQQLNGLLDTQKAEEAAKKKREEIRTQLGNLLTENRALMNACINPPSANYACESAANTWFLKAQTYIAKNLEPSYVSRFINASGLGLSYTGADAKTNGILNGLNFRATALEQFIREILN
jgi:hypothetical protein